MNWVTVKARSSNEMVGNLSYKLNSKKSLKLVVEREVVKERVE